MASAAPNPVPLPSPKGGAAQAMALHQAGHLDQAIAAYRQVLLAAPQHLEALHGLGVALHQQNDPAALALLARAAGLAPRRADIALNYGLSLLRSGALPQAAAQFAQAARLNPASPEAQYNLANTLRDTGDRAAAQRAFRRALKLRPDYPQAAVNLATLLRDSGHTEQALPIYREVVARHPHLPDAWNNLGTALVELHDRPAAVAAFRAALRLRPDFPTAQVNLATLLAMEDDLHAGAQARALFAAALPTLQLQAERAPDRSVLAVLAEALRGLNRYAEAEAILVPAVARYPDHCRLILALIETRIMLNQADAALECLDQHDAAEKRATPDMQTRWHMLRGITLRELQRLDESAAALRHALRLSPAAPEPRYHLAQTLLQAGQLTAGFAAFEARIPLLRPRALPAGLHHWAGGNPAGHRITVFQEQGMGDTVQFARFLPRLAAAGATVTACVSPTLVRLIGALPGVTAVPVGATPPADAGCLMMSLPHVLGGDWHGLGAPYLVADPAAVESWRHWLRALPRVASGDMPRTVGLSWAGNPDYFMDHLRSIPPAALAPLAAAPVRFVALRPGEDTGAIPGITLADPSPRIADLADTAALIAALDLVITVDTVTAHLAGALGRPVWLLNRFNTDWRWGTAPNDTLWYASMRQFRQPRPGDWTTPIAAIARALHA